MARPGEQVDRLLGDRTVQREKTFTGIPTVPFQDQAVTESMGAIYDRTQEHLATLDGMVIQVWQRAIDAAKALAEHGTTPPCVDNPELYRVRSASATPAKGAPWHEELHHWLYAKTIEIPEVVLAIPGERALLGAAGSPRV